MKKLKSIFTARKFYATLATIVLLCSGHYWAWCWGKVDKLAALEPK